MNLAKDLTKEPPRSPRDRLGGYVILARTTDKCRALLGGHIGEYHYDCPLDNMLFGFKGVTGDDFKAKVRFRPRRMARLSRRPQDRRRSKRVERRYSSRQPLQ